MKTKEKLTRHLVQQQSTYDHKRIANIRKTYMKPRIVAFIPAHNEEKSIFDCIAGLGEQILPAGVELDVFVVCDNCTDRTEEIALAAGAEFRLNLQVIITKNNKQRKVGALNTVWKYIYGDMLDIYSTETSAYQKIYQQSVKAILGMDADSRLAPEALIQLWTGLMSARNIGGVMAKYTMRMPKKKSKLATDDVYYEQKIASGEYGGPVSRWWTHQQKQDMASWLLKLQYLGGSTYVLGGQATLFRPEAMLDIINKNKLDGPWQNDSDVEDMLLTWQLQQAGWKTLISPKARCFVDAMKSYHTFREQRNKWQSGTVDLLTNKDLDLKTRHTGVIWRSQLRMVVDLFIRVLFLALFTVAFVTEQFHWSWIWITPVILSSVLNIVLALKTPMHRPIDVILAGLVISSEIYLCVNLITFCQVWAEKLSVNKKDGWANQYAAENGTTRSKIKFAIIVSILFIGSILSVNVYYHSFLISPNTQQIFSPYLEVGWKVLTVLTIYQSVANLYQLWTLRGSHTA